MAESDEPVSAGSSSQANELHGIGLLILALFFFAALDATSKYLAQGFAVPVLIWVRYSVHCLLMLIFLAPRMGWRLLQVSQPRLQVLRALMLLSCTGFGVTAFSLMPLAETTAIAFLAPLFVALLAGPWLGERITPLHWLAVVLGLLGVMLIARPGGATTPEGVACALGAAVCLAAYQLLTRRLSGGENPLAMLFYTALVGAVLMTAGLPWMLDSPWPSLSEAFWMIALGVFGGTGHWLMILALRRTPASLLAPFMYLQLVWASLLGAMVFGHWPDTWALLGMAVVVGSGLLLAWQTRNAQRGRG